MKREIISPPITWFGSKSRLVKKIVSYFPKHTTFVDAFGGSGAILLGKRPSKVEVYPNVTLLNGYICVTKGLFFSKFCTMYSMYKPY